MVDDNVGFEYPEDGGLDPRLGEVVEVEEHTELRGRSHPGDCNREEVTGHAGDDPEVGGDQIGVELAEVMKEGIEKPECERQAALDGPYHQTMKETERGVHEKVADQAQASPAV